MIHLGDITKINGAEIPPVDVITGGSPCQDLSVAGKRAGLDGERSGLFMEQIRIIKEMRDATANDHRGPLPRYMVWENVPGAFSSGTPKGEDFRIVLEETAKVTDPAAVIPRPEGGRWSKAGAIVGDGWSIAWRIHDAQFWGVPQRRRRIALVADFRGASAPEILFERKGLHGDPSESGAKGKGTAEGTEGSLGSAGYTIKKGMKVKCFAEKRFFKWQEDEVSVSLRNHSGSYGSGSEVLSIVDIYSMQRIDEYKPALVGSALKQRDYKDATDLVVIDGGDLVGKYVRRLTPKEAERLQGFPDGWTDIGEWTDSTGKKRQTSDTNRYKALGNSIALPYWKVLARRIAAQYDRDITMGSLFDGISGFCVAFAHTGATPVWSSEIEEFCIAVCKKHFGDEDDGTEGDYKRFL